MIKWAQRKCSVSRVPVFCDAAYGKVSPSPRSPNSCRDVSIFWELVVLGDRELSRETASSNAENQVRLFLGSMNRLEI